MSRFRDFHQDKTKTMPDFYRREYRRKLGPLADLITDADMVPLL
jgi:hypothetical protein